MAFFGLKNLALTTVATAPSPATSGTSLTVATGEGALLPATAFYATVCPSIGTPTTAVSEIVLVSRSGDVCTLTRAQSGTTARTIVVGDRIFAGIYAENLAELQAYLTDSVTGTLNFSTAGEDGFTTVTITCAWAVSGDQYTAEIYGTTSDHDAEDAMVEGITAQVISAVTSTSVTVAASAPHGTWGTYNVRVRRV